MLNKQRGVTFVELVIGISVISVVVIVFLNSFRFLVGNSVDPLLKKQSVMIATAIMDEVTSKTFTKNIDGFSGPFVVSNREQFDAVMDYNGFTMNGIRNINGLNIAGLENYSVSVSINNEALGSLLASQVMSVRVVVTDPSGGQITLKSYRINYEE